MDHNGWIVDGNHDRGKQRMGYGTEGSLCCKVKVGHLLDVTHEDLYMNRPFQINKSVGRLTSI